MPSPRTRLHLASMRLPVARHASCPAPSCVFRPRVSFIPSRFTRLSLTQDASSPHPSRSEPHPRRVFPSPITLGTSPKTRLPLTHHARNLTQDTSSPHPSRSEPHPRHVFPSPKMRLPPNHGASPLSHPRGPRCPILRLPPPDTASWVDACRVFAHPETHNGHTSCRDRTRWMTGVDARSRPSATRLEPCARARTSSTARRACRRRCGRGPCRGGGRRDGRRHPPARRWCGRPRSRASHGDDLGADDDSGIERVHARHERPRGGGADEVGVGVLDVGGPEELVRGGALAGVPHVEVAKDERRAEPRPAKAPRRGARVLVRRGWRMGTSGSSLAAPGLQSEP